MPHAHSLLVINIIMVIIIIMIILIHQQHPFKTILHAIISKEQLKTQTFLLISLLYKACSVFTHTTNSIPTFNFSHPHPFRTKKGLNSFVLNRRSTNIFNPFSSSFMFKYVWFPSISRLFPLSTLHTTQTILPFFFFCSLKIRER